MTPDQWERLSAWHSAWLAADLAKRRELRDELASSHPDLVALADDLVSEGDTPQGFLETPAMLLTAAALARGAALEPGTELGPYRIVGLVGSGGMGIVYRATDVRLGRDVAVKMLVPLGAPDAAQVDRFFQEARLTASIDHPNVVKVYDVGQRSGQPYMVIELLEGESLRARLDRGALTVPETCRIVSEVAKGLVAAHGAGLVHRDLKPENIFLCRSGQPKILDFGIAKLTSDPARDRADASTLTGILLGTAGYLAPEQVRGERAIDGRADLFALGSMLFEMLAGHRLFAGESTVDTLHAILHERAPDLIEVCPAAPPALTAIAARLLEKAPSDRFQSAADLVWALGQVDGARREAPAPDGLPPRRQPASGWARVAAIAAPLLVMASLAGWFVGRQSQESSTPAAPVRFSWSLPAGTGLVSAPVVAPDSRSVAWVGVDEAGIGQLYVREMGATDARSIPGTEGAHHPFWSPDSRAIGFFARGQLKRVAVDNGTPVVLAAAPDARGGAWGTSGTIVFQPVYRETPLMKVSDQGGEATPATLLDASEQDVSHRWPSFLPDGRHFVYTVLSSGEGRSGVFIGGIDDPPAVPERRLFESVSSAVFVPSDAGGPGVLLSVSGQRLTARRFDSINRVVIGEAWTLDVGGTPASPHHPALLSASPGVLVVSDAAIPWGAHFARVARDGSDLRIGTDQELGGFPRVSPDGRHVARAIVDVVKTDPDIWIEDLYRGGRLRLTTAPTFDLLPVWSPDGREVAYRSGTMQEPFIGFSAADGSGPTRALPCPRQPCEPTDWAPDGRSLAVNVTESEIWAVPLDGTAQPVPLFVEPFPVRDGRFSPDGRWIAYVSEESGRAEVSVRSVDGPSRRSVASIDGGDQPVWRRDGRELFFADPEGRLYAVPVRWAGDGRLELGAPERLAVPSLGERHWGTTYDVSNDGGQIFFPHPGDDRPPQSFDVIVNWWSLVMR